MKFRACLGYVLGGSATERRLSRTISTNNYYTLERSKISGLWRPRPELSQAQLIVKLGNLAYASLPQSDGVVLKHERLQPNSGGGEKVIKPL